MSIIERPNRHQAECGVLLIDEYSSGQYYSVVWNVTWNGDKLPIDVYYAVQTFDSVFDMKIEESKHPIGYNGPCYCDEEDYRIYWGYVPSYASIKTNAILMALAALICFISVVVLVLFVK